MLPRLCFTEGEVVSARTVGLPLLTFCAQQPRQMLGEAWVFHFHTAELTIQEQPKMGKRWCPGLLFISPSSPTSCTQHLPPEGMVAASCRREPEKMLLLALFFSCCTPALWAMAVFLMRCHVEGWALRHAEWCKEEFLPNFRHVGVLSLSSQ